MSELSLKEIQSQSLEVLQTVHEFCVAEGIQYSLAYGTLIGAIRHKGFIPWDDDIDIIMPRPDYERFPTTTLITAASSTQSRRVVIPSSRSGRITREASGSTSFRQTVFRMTMKLSAAM